LLLTCFLGGLFFEARVWAGWLAGWLASRRAQHLEVQSKRIWEMGYCGCTQLL